jgi:hypothetical protein
MQIDHLRLRIPGLNRVEAERLRIDVQTLIYRYLPEEVARCRLGALNLKIRVPHATPREQLAELIARQICGSLP